MHVTLYNQFGALNSGPVFDAVYQGLQRLGVRVSWHDDTADVAVIWSVLWAGRMRSNQMVWQQFQQSGRPVIVAEVGMIDRGRTWKLGVNGTGRQAYPVTELDSGRVKTLNLNCADWRRSGQHILIATQRADSQQWHGQPALDQWLEQTVNKVRSYSHRPIMVRPHPRYPVKIPTGCALARPRKVINTYDSFDFATALSNAWAVINHNSAPGVQAVLAGVPAFVHQDSVAAEVANHDLAMIERPLCPDRQRWLTWLAHTEWTVQEIATGLPLRRLLTVCDTKSLDDLGAQ